MGSVVILRYILCLILVFNGAGVSYSLIKAPFSSILKFWLIMANAQATISAIVFTLQYNVKG